MHYEAKQVYTEARGIFDRGRATVRRGTVPLVMVAVFYFLYEITYFELFRYILLLSAFSAIGFSSYLIYLLYSLRHLDFSCPHCKHLIRADAAPWVCGNCYRTHKDPYSPSSRAFVERCFCGHDVHSLTCPQCRQPIIFDQGRYNHSQTAYFPGSEPRPLPEPEPEPDPTLIDYIPLGDRTEHTLIIAKPRVGKSEAIKALVHDLLEQPAAAFILDPHGAMSYQIGRWPHHRIVYLEYGLKEGYTPTINPFQIYKVDPTDTSERALGIKANMAEQLVDAFQLLTEDFTFNMETILFSCIVTLLDMPGATISDLRDFMVKGEQDRLVSFGVSRSYDPDNARFFKHDFHDSHLNSAKSALRTKLHRVLSSRSFRHFTCGPTKVFLDQLLHDRKIVVFNLSKIENEAATCGALVLSLLQGVVKRRANIDKLHPIQCHVFADECYYFVNKSTPKLMAENLKYGMILTLAHQHMGQMPRDLEGAIHKLTHVNLLGVNTIPQQKGIAQTFHVHPNDLSSLQVGQFLVCIGNKAPFILPFPQELLGDSACMSDAAWHSAKQSMIDRYYRPIAAPPSPPQRRPDPPPPPPDRFNVDRV